MKNEISSKQIRKIFQIDSGVLFNLESGFVLLINVQGFNINNYKYLFIIKLHYIIT